MPAAPGSDKSTDPLTAGTPTHSSQTFEQLLSLLATSRRTIDIASPNLEPALFDEVKVIDALARLARNGRQSRIRILIADDTPVNLERHRLLALARRLTSTVSLHVLCAHPEWRNQTVIISDGKRAMLLEPGRSTKRLLENPVTVSPWTDIFARLWHASEESAELKVRY